MEKTPSEDNVRMLLTLAAQNGLTDIQEVFRSLFFRHDHPVVAYLSTVARLRYLETTLIQAVIESAPITLSDACDMARDVKRMAGLLQVKSGSVSKEEAALMFKGLLEDAEVSKAAEEAAARAAEPEAPNRYSAALADLNEAMTEIQRKRAESEGGGIN